MSIPKVSIIIPVHNVEKYLNQCLDSVVNQTLEDIEIICIDDCSTDASPDILKQYEKNYNNIKLLSLDKSGSALVARRKGIEEASGEYIMFLDADDFLDKNGCKQAFDKIVETGADIVNFSSNVINCANLSHEKIEGTQEFLKPYAGFLYNEDVFKGCFTERKYSHNLWSKIYKSEICKKLINMLTEH